MHVIYDIQIGVNYSVIYSFFVVDNKILFTGCVDMIVVNFPCPPVLFQALPTETPH